MKFEVTFTAVALTSLWFWCLQVAAQGTTSDVLPPSPTNSGQCVPHGNHWDCHDPTETGHMDGHGDDHSTGPGTLGPSPTNSPGCVAHGDHWDCEGTDDHHPPHDDDHYNGTITKTAEATTGTTVITSGTLTTVITFTTTPAANSNTTAPTSTPPATLAPNAAGKVTLGFSSAFFVAACAALFL